MLQKIKVFFFLFYRSNLCTGSGFRDTGSGFRNGKYNFVYDVVHDANIGSPCRGDQGTSLMVKENERCCNEVYARNSLQNRIHCRRYTVAGVFSKSVNGQTIAAWTLLYMRKSMVKLNIGFGKLLKV